MVYKPDDLKDTSEVDPKDSDYFLVTVTDLNPGDEYKFQFAWIYTDRASIADDKWSITKVVTASTEAQPKAPRFLQTDLSSDLEKIFVQWTGLDKDGGTYKGIDRVEVFISDENNTFGDGTKPVTSFKVAGKKSITAPAGEYTVTLKAVTVLGTYSDPSDERTITVDPQAGEVIEAPTNPNGFTVTRVLGGLELAWAGTYANGTFKGFSAIEVFVGNSSTATQGTYIAAGVLTGDKVVNKIIIPVDGTYCRYNQPVYIHARAVNKLNEFGTLQQNVASDLLGARSAIADDLEDNIISELKLINGAITATKISDGAIETAKLAANAITADKVATNAITAGKIQALSIDVSKLAAGTLSVNNLEAGNISSTSYIRAGSAGSARVEISSSQVGLVLAGLHIYGSDGNPVLEAPLTGGLTITGDINATGGYIGSSTDGWLISEFGLFATSSSSIIDLGDLGILDVGSGFIDFGNYTMTGLAGSFWLYETINGNSIDIFNTEFNGRLILGSESSSGRQVEVGRSAQVAGSYSTASGGLRNMYTIAQANYTSTIYLSDKTTNGDVLLIYDPSS